MGLLADALVQRGGYNMTDALNAENGPRAGELAREFLGGSSGGGMSTIPSFSFDQKAAEDKALAELAPYYEKLLAMYGGDVALAKQRLDQDYQIGLRTKTENTEWAKSDIDTSAIERKRKMGIAMNDLDQNLNARGIYTSGIQKQEQGKIAATEAYSAAEDTRARQELDKGLTQYTSEQNLSRNRSLEEMGYMKPVNTQTTGQYAPSQAGVTAPAGFSVSGFKSQPEQKVVALDQEKKQKAIDMANMDYQKQRTKWSDLRDQALTMMQ